MDTMIITNTGASGTIGSMNKANTSDTTAKKHQLTPISSRACSGYLTRFAIPEGVRRASDVVSFMTILLVWFRLSTDSLKPIE
jgi:hypothetical protein